MKALGVLRHDVVPRKNLLRGVLFHVGHYKHSLVNDFGHQITIQAVQGCYFVGQNLVVSLKLDDKLGFIFEKVLANKNFTVRTFPYLVANKVSILQNLSHQAQEPVCVTINFLGGCL